MRSITKAWKNHKNEGKIKGEFTAKNLTPFGGLGLLSQFMRKLNLKKVLNEIDPSQTGVASGGQYSVGEKILALVYGMVCDLERPADTEVLQRDSVFQTLTDYQSYPDQSTHSRFLGSFVVKGAQEIGEQDSQMLVKVRHNFSDWVIPFLKECLRIIPGHILQLYLRCDSGFYSFEYLSFLEKSLIKYAIAVKLYKTIQKQLGGLDYRDIGGGVEVSEYEQVLRQGKKQLSCRMVGIREESKEDQKAKNKH